MISSDSPAWWQGYLIGKNGIVELTNRNRLMLVLITAIGAVIGGHIAFWNQGLRSGGLGFVLVAYFICCPTAFAVYSAFAEMCSALPFGGNEFCTIYEKIIVLTVLIILQEEFMLSPE
jgi:amino acid permease